MPTPERPHGDLGAKITLGTFWTVSMRLGIRLLGLISVVILARILLPKDYGIVAQAVMVYSFLELMTAFGLENALIRDQSAIKDDYDTVWTIQIIRGLAIAVVLSLLAIPASTYFRQPELEMIVYVYAAISLVNGFNNVGIVDFRKHFRFDLDFKFNVYRRLVAFIVTVIAAYQLRSYWAFVIGTAAGAITGLALSFTMSSFRPGITLKKWRSLFDFSKWVLADQLISALSTRLDTFILGRFSTSEQLGLYSVSGEVANTASTEIAMPVGRAMLPALSAAQNDLETFQTLYLSTMSLVLAVAIPAALGVSALSDEIALVLLGKNWIAAGPIIFLLAFQGIGRVVRAMATSAFISFGRVDLVTKLSVAGLFITSISLGAGFYLGAFWGLVWGAVVASSATGLLSLLVQSAIGQLNIRQLVLGTWRVVVAASAMWFFLFEFRIATGFGVLADLLASISSGGAVYLLILVALWLLSRRPPGPEQTLVNYVVRRRAAG